MPLLVLTLLLPEEPSKGCRCDKEYSPHQRETRAELDVRTNTPASGRARTAVAQPWRTRDLSGDRLPVADELSKIFELAVPACRDQSEMLTISIQQMSC